MVDEDTIGAGAPTVTEAATLAAHIPGDDLAAKIDALHARHFAGTELTIHTPLWNKVMAFKEAVKALVDERAGTIEAAQCGEGINAKS